MVEVSGGKDFKIVVIGDGNTNKYITLQTYTVMLI